MFGRVGRRTLSRFGVLLVAGLSLAFVVPTTMRSATADEIRPGHYEGYNSSKAEAVKWAKQLNQSLITHAEIVHAICRGEAIAENLNKLNFTEHVIRVMRDAVRIKLNNVLMHYKGWSKARNVLGDARTVDAKLRGNPNSTPSQLFKAKADLEAAEDAFKAADAELRSSEEKSIFQEAGLSSAEVPSEDVCAFSGFELGFQISETSGLMKWKESLNGETTNQGSVRRDPAGIGFKVGYGFRPWGNNLIVAPFVSFDYLNWSINQTFANGNLLGTRSNFESTLGVKVGPAVTPNIWLYAIGGVSALNQTLKVNFMPLASSTTKTVAGGTAGVGAAIRPDFLQGFGRPVSISLEYQHTWWANAQFDMPAASPLFNYNFRREDDTIKLGFNVYLTPPPATPAPSNMYVKAPPSR
jgi:hypothetical protein